MTDSTPSLKLSLQTARFYLFLTRRLDTVLGAHHGLSFSDFTLLYHLSQAPNHKLRRSQLAQQATLTASGVTRALQPLEKIGLVTREADGRDARVGFAVLTAAGLELTRNAEHTAEQVSQELFAGVPAEQRKVLADLLGKPDLSLNAVNGSA